MSDQEDFDQQLTSSQEYGIAFFVILLFGAMYLFFMKGCQPDGSGIGQLFSPTQTAAQETQGDKTVTSAYQKAMAYADASKRADAVEQASANREANPSGQLGSDASQQAAGIGVTGEGVQPDADTKAALAKADADAKALAQAQEAARIKAEAAKLAAATAAQKLVDQERFEAQQAQLRAGQAELAIPKKPLTTASTTAPSTPTGTAQTTTAGATPSTKTPTQSAVKTNPVQQGAQTAQAKTSQNSAQPTANPSNQPFNLQEEWARVNFKLPDGRSVQIPKEGFENRLKQAILQDQNNQAIVFDRVYFFSGSEMLNPESSNQILGVAGILNTYKAVNIKLRGHTDSTGPDEENLTLSFKRSLNLKKQLVGLGIDTQRIQVEGLGASEPISDNGSERGRNKNRRIDLVIIK